MMIDTETRHVTPADGNIFLDLGFAPEEASALLAQSKGIIDEKRRLKEQLMEEMIKKLEALCDAEEQMFNFTYGAWYSDCMKQVDSFPAIDQFVIKVREVLKEYKNG